MPRTKGAVGTRCSGVIRASCSDPCVWITSHGCKNKNKLETTTTKPKKQSPVSNYSTPIGTTTQSPSFDMTNNEIRKIIKENMALHIEVQDLKDDIKTLQAKLKRYVAENKVLKAK